MRFNVKKCCILRISNLHSISNSTYAVNSIPLQVVEQYHYLGVLIDNKLSRTPHIHWICNKSIKPSTSIPMQKPPSLSTSSHKAYLQTDRLTIYWILFYYVDPYQQTSIHKLEVIQHHAARFILNKPWKKNHRDSITDMLQSLNWPLLKKRRRHLHIILLFKFVNRLIHIPTQ